MPTKQWRDLFTKTPSPNGVSVRHTKGPNQHKAVTLSLVRAWLAAWRKDDKQAQARSLREMANGILGRLPCQANAGLEQNSLLTRLDSSPLSPHPEAGPQLKARLLYTCRKYNVTIPYFLPRSFHAVC